MPCFVRQVITDSCECVSVHFTASDIPLRGEENWRVRVCVIACRRRERQNCEIPCFRIPVTQLETGFPHIVSNGHPALSFRCVTGEPGRPSGNLASYFSAAVNNDVTTPFPTPKSKFRWAPRKKETEKKEKKKQKKKTSQKSTDSETVANVSVAKREKPSPPKRATK